MFKILCLIVFISTNVLAKEEAYLSYVAKYNPPQNKELVFSENLDTTDAAKKSKSFVPNKFFSYVKNIKKVSMFSESSDPKKNYLVSFFFHGEPNQFALKVGPVDLRRYFLKKIDLEKTDNQCLKRVQSHFEEYNRKSKVYYLEQEKLELTTEDPFFEIAFKAQENYLVKKNPSPSFVITNNCRGVGNFEYEWPGLMKGHFFIPPQFLDKLMGEYDQLVDGKKIIPLDHYASYTELRTTKFYANQNKLGGWNGLKNKFVQWYSSAKDETYQWYDLGDFDSAAKNCPLSSIEPMLVKKDQKSLEITLPIEYKDGPIDYMDFAAETRMKSGSVFMQDSLAYTKTFCKSGDFTSPPPNFLVPEGEKNISTVDYWNQNKCALIPHFFANYEDIRKYPVYLSKFEIDGVYVGRSRNENDPVMTDYDRGLQKDETKRVPYSFSEYIGNYKKATVTTLDGFLTVKLHNKDHNIVIGNIPLAKLNVEETKPVFVSSLKEIDLMEKNVDGVVALFGINPQPLVSNYSDTFDPDVIEYSPVPFALMYDDRGNILNHHLPKYGIEQWYARKRGCKLVIDLLSHERIIPLARLQMDYFCSGEAQTKR